jgi:hypothetical protein
MVLQHEHVQYGGGYNNTLALVHMSMCICNLENYYVIRQDMKRSEAYRSILVPTKNMQARRNTQMAGI